MAMPPAVFDGHNDLPDGPQWTTAQRDWIEANPLPPCGVGDLRGPSTATFAALDG